MRRMLTRAALVPIFVAIAGSVYAQATAAINGRVLNRANFGNSYGGSLFSPTTYNRPIGHLGGIGSTSTIPISFQVQFGTRLAF